MTVFRPLTWAFSMAFWHSRMTALVKASMAHWLVLKPDCSWIKSFTRETTTRVSTSVFLGEACDTGEGVTMRRCGSWLGMLVLCSGKVSA